MTSDLSHGITSFVCRITNGDSVTPQVRVEKIDHEPQFVPQSIKYDGDIHLIKIEF